MADGQLVLRIDALAEVLLAGGCVALAVAGGRAGWARLPGHVGAGIMLAVAAVLLVVAGVLWWLSGRPARSTLALVAAGNAVTAVAAAWYAPVVDAGAGVRLLLAACAAALAALAAIEGLLARRVPARQVAG